MGYKNGQYWRGEENENLKILLTTDNTSREWSVAYKRILPRLRRMAESILRKYYSYYIGDNLSDLTMDGIFHLLLNGKYDPDKPNLFAYAGTVLKRFYYSLFIAEKKKNLEIDKNYDPNSSEYIQNYWTEFPDFDDLKTEREEQLEEILEIIDKGIETNTGIVIRNHEKNKKKYRGSKEFKDWYASIRRERELCFLYNARTYFVENFMETEVSSIAMADFIDARCEIPSDTLRELQQKYFSIGSQVEKRDERKTMNWLEIRGESYLMDDICPSDGLHARSNLSRMKKKITDMEKYKYF